MSKFEELYEGATIPKGCEKHQSVIHFKEKCEADGVDAIVLITKNAPCGGIYGRKSNDKQ